MIVAVTDAVGLSRCAQGRNGGASRCVNKVMMTLGRCRNECDHRPTSFLNVPVLQSFEEVIERVQKLTDENFSQFVLPIFAEIEEVRRLDLHNQIRPQTDGDLERSCLTWKPWTSGIGGSMCAERRGGWRRSAKHLVQLEAFLRAGVQACKEGEEGRKSVARVKWSVVPSSLTCPTLWSSPSYSRSRADL